MDLMQLQYFVQVAKLESITKAAEVLHISQPALSLSIKRLEDELGVELFNRVRKRIFLNEVGQDFLNELLPTLKQLDNLNRKFDRSSKVSRPSIHINLRAASVMIINAITDYSKTHRDIDLHIHHNHNNTNGYEIDIFTQAADEQLTINDVVLFEEPVHFVVPVWSKLAELAEIDLDMITDEAFVMLDSAQPLRSVFNRFCSAAHIEPNIHYELTQVELTKAVLTAGLGVGFWPACWGRFNETNAKLVDIHSPKCTRCVVMRYLPDFVPGSAADIFSDYLMNYSFDLFSR